MPAAAPVTSFQPRIELNPAPVGVDRRAEILDDPGFGRYFTDHMVLIDWDPENGWHDERVVPYGPLSLDPATAALHYAQEIFEGLKAYRHEDDSVWVFRPDQNAERFQRSASPDPARVSELLEEHVRRFYADFHASAPAPDRPID